MSTAPPIEHETSPHPLQTERVHIRIDGALLADAQRYASEHKMTFSQLIRSGLRRQIGRRETVVNLDLVNGGGGSYPAETIYGAEDAE